MANFNWAVAAAAALLTFATAEQAQAVPIGIFSTGVDAFGNPVLDGSLDPHYTVSPGFGPFAIGDPASVGWIGNTLTSQWISPAPSTRAGPGSFTYTTTFDLTGLDPTLAVLKGKIAIDDEGSIFLNGVDVFDSPPVGLEPWTFFKSFKIASGFVAGVNTLQIVVPNGNPPGNGPTGVQLNIRGRVGPVIPEPATLGLLGAALAFFGVARRRRA